MKTQCFILLLNESLIATDQLKTILLVIYLFFLRGKWKILLLNLTALDAKFKVPMQVAYSGSLYLKNVLFLIRSCLSNFRQVYLGI